MYKFVSDNFENTTKGFINQEDILKYVTEEQIFELVFGYLPEENVYVSSPFRIDNQPSCFFERGTSYKNRLRFVDYGDPSINKPMDCFDAIQRYYEIDDFYKTLSFIYDKLIRNKNLVVIPTKKEIITKKEKTIITIVSRNFNIQDQLFWQKYEISKKNLIDDHVFPITKYGVINGSKGDYTKFVDAIAYCYTDFESFNKKIYLPTFSKRFRFISTCDKNDIGGIRKLPPFAELLIITKSYKDWRVLTNNGYYSIWLQNEGTVPDLLLLNSVISKFKKIIVFFDNDRTGLEASEKLTNIINNHFHNKAKKIWIPEELNTKFNISDPSDFIAKDSKLAKQFLKQNLK